MLFTPTDNSPSSPPKGRLDKKEGYWKPDGHGDRLNGHRSVPASHRRLATPGESEAIMAKFCQFMPRCEGPRQALAGIIGIFCVWSPSDVGRLPRVWIGWYIFKFSARVVRQHNPPAAQNHVVAAYMDFSVADWVDENACDHLVVGPRSDPLFRKSEGRDKRQHWNVCNDFAWEEDRQGQQQNAHDCQDYLPPEGKVDLEHGRRPQEITIQVRQILTILTS